MADKELLALVEKLEHEAEAADLETERREDLMVLAERLRRRALAPRAEDPEDRVEDEVKEVLTEFEVSHPRLTGVLDRILLALSSLGI